MSGEHLTDRDAERELVGQLMVAHWHLRQLLVEQKLTADVFSDTACRCLFDAIVQVKDRGGQPSDLILAAELEKDARLNGADPRALIQGFYGVSYDSLLFDLVARLQDLHRRRQLRHAAELIATAADEGSDGPLQEAERLLSQPADTEQTSWSPAELQSFYFDQFQSGDVEAWPWPLPRMNDWTGRGFRRGQYILIGGWSSHGKSVFLDQILEHAASLPEQLRVHLYLNEMSRPERLDRFVARLSGVPFGRLYNRRLKDDDHAKVVAAIPSIKVGMTDCSGWTAPEICRHIRWNKWDVVGLDILHNIEHREERDLAEISGLLNATAISTGCALLAAVHLNDNRVVSPKRPVPVLRDIRGSGMLQRHANTVLFVHRDDDEDGIPGNSAVILASKIRNGSPAAMKVLFEPSRMRFRADLEVVASRRGAGNPDAWIEPDRDEAVF